jgi:NCAIR mutase (PurE)-related protein
MTEIEKIITDCRAAADYYDEPMSGIYRTIAQLAEVVKKQQHAIAAAAGAAGSRGPYR